MPMLIKNSSYRLSAEAIRYTLSNRRSSFSFVTSNMPRPISVFHPSAVTQSLGSLHDLEHRSVCGGAQDGVRFEVLLRKDGDNHADRRSCPPVSAAFDVERDALR